MMAEKKTEKISLTDFARDVAIGCSCGRDQLQQILQLLQNQKAFNVMSGYQIFKERGLDPALNRKTSEKAENHMVFTCDL